MFATPKDDQDQMHSNEITTEENKTHRTILYVLGFFLLIITLWGVSQIKIATDLITKQTVEENTVPNIENTHLQDEIAVNEHLEMLLAEDSNPVVLSEEEVKVHLEKLAIEEGEGLMLTEEEVRAKLEMLPEPEHEEGHDADHVHSQDDI